MSRALINLANVSVFSVNEIVKLQHVPNTPTCNYSLFNSDEVTWANCSRMIVSLCITDCMLLLSANAAEPQRKWLNERQLFDIQSFPYSLVFAHYRYSRLFGALEYFRGSIYIWSVSDNLIDLGPFFVAVCTSIGVCIKANLRTTTCVL